VTFVQSAWTNATLVRGDASGGAFAAADLRAAGALTNRPTERGVRLALSARSAARSPWRHSRALLTGSAPGAVEFVLADLTDPAAVLGDPRLRAVMDLAEPVGLLLVSVLMYVADDVVGEIVDALVGALAPGSVVAISHPTADFAPEVVARAAAVGRESGLTYIARTRREVERLFTGLELCPPGVAAMPEWHPVTCAAGLAAPAASTHYWVGMARKRSGA
jgi:S-adenosyl methyltransferase